MGIKCVTYIDDGIGAKAVKENARIAGQQMLRDLEQAGFHINVEKSNFEPVQRGQWLGTIIDTRSMTFHVPTSKVENLKNRYPSSIGEIFGDSKRPS